VPPTKTPLVPREVKAHEGAALSLTMGLVDGSTKKIIVSDNFTVQDVLIAYASKLGLWQVDFFSLAESRPGKSGTFSFIAHAPPHTHTHIDTHTHTHTHIDTHTHTHTHTL
jgi:hypothetical protein